MILNTCILLIEKIREAISALKLVYHTHIQSSCLNGKRLTVTSTVVKWKANGLLLPVVLGA